jgi:hypothetical protein
MMMGGSIARMSSGEVILAIKRWHRGIQCHAYPWVNWISEEQKIKTEIYSVLITREFKRIRILADYNIPHESCQGGFKNIIFLKRLCFRLAI